MVNKRRKLNNNCPKAKRGLDYFFAKQQGKSPSVIPSSVSSFNTESINKLELTDEEIARKLQEEWNKEDAQSQYTEQNDIPKQTLENGTLIETKISPLKLDNSQHQQNTKIFEEKNSKENSCTTSIGINSEKTLSLQSLVETEDTITSGIPFDENPLIFNPTKYLKDKQGSILAEDGSASYAILTRCFFLINKTSSRIKIVDTLVNLLRTLIEGDPNSVLPSVWLATNAISPPYVPLELGLGGSAISKALKNVYNLDAKSLKTLYDKFGDAGDVAFELKKRQTYILRKPKPLTIKGVYQALVNIATTQGNGSGEFKQRIVEKLLQDTQGAEESRFIVRILCRHLRIGAVKMTMLIALSRAFQLSKRLGAVYPLKSVENLSSISKVALAELWSKGEELVKACYARRPNYSDLVPALLKYGVCDELLIECCLDLHVPIRPMLGSITRDLSEMLTKFKDQKFTCEYKYDGQRAQIHCDDRGNVSIFSRHLEIMTDKYPDLIVLIPKIRGENVTSFIMEGEVVAVDALTGELKPFQTLSNRARKDVAIGSIKINVCFFAFDLMYLNGESLLIRPFRERRKLLRNLFTEVKFKFTWVKSLDATSEDSEKILKFFRSAIESKCEGLMAKLLDDQSIPYEGYNLELPCTTESFNLKDLDNHKIRDKQIEKIDRRKAFLSTYEPDKRLESWLKIKKDYNTNFDTLDLIPIAAWHGQGRKSKWWSPILLAVRNETTGSLEAVCKCISGFTDEFYKENKEFYSEDGPNVLSNKPGYIEYKGGHPDVWFEPQEVFEIAFADLTQSPVYTAAIGLVSEERGLSMRFPRFVKKRNDKSIDEASTSELLATLWEKQEATSFSTDTSKRNCHDDME